MPIEIVVPRLGWSMDEGTLVEWLKKDGEFVSAGEMLFVLEGEKASQEIESFDSGFLHIPPDAPQPGDDVVVGQLLAYLLAAGEPPPSRTGAAHAAQPDPSAAAATARSAPSPAATPARSASRIAATPRARRRARQLGIDWSQITGSGRNGRIRERDVLAFAAQARLEQR